LTVDSTPSGAELTIDGKPMGRAPVELDVPEKSTVVILAELPEHEAWRQEVVVSRDRQQVSARLVTLAADAGTADAGAPPAAKEPTKKATVKKKAAPKKKATKKKRR
jgi:hypothetical protein